MWLRFGATCCRPFAAGRPGRLRGANASGGWHGSAVFVEPWRLSASGLFPREENTGQAVTRVYSPR
jgi:hypothetical protein